MQSIKFSDIATFCYGKMPDKAHIVENGFPIFSGYQISGYYDTYNCESDKLVLIARGVGGTGEIRKTSDKCWLTNLAIKISLKNEDLALKNYLFYKFQANDLRILRSGSAQPQITINDLMDYEFAVPNLVEQRHIVDTIGSVDNLIEKNDEIIAKTHEYIDKKFKSFTNGFDKVKISELDYFNICKSVIKSFSDEKIYLDTASVDQTNIIDESYIITYDNRPSRANMQPIKNSVWFAKLKDSPKYILVKEKSKNLVEKFVFSTGFLGLQSEDDLINYLYCLILSDEFNNQKNLLSNGATMQGINNETFGEIKVPSITKAQAIEFGKTIDDNVNLIIDLKNKNHKLKEIKSQLLQKYFG